MTRTITEAINGVSMTIPTAYDFFDVQATALPNAQPAIRMLGQGNPTDLRAYGPAPTMSPNIFKVKSYNWSLSLWFNVNGNANHGGPLFVVQNASAGGSMSLDMPLYISWGGINATAIGVQYYSASGSVNIGRGSNNPSGWYFFVFRFPSSGQQITSYMNADAAFTNHGTMPGGSDTYNTGLQVAFGRYPATAPLGSMYTNPMIGKFSFHNHLLSLTECHMLYEAMV